jgi:uncharacterized protein (DUF302 family)
MSKDCRYGFGTEIPVEFEDALSRVEALLQKHGFQIYTRLNLKDIMGDSKIDNLDKYMILGACNVEFAKELFSADPDIGMLMPCNIVIYELNTGKSRIMIKDPLRVMDLISHPVAVEAAMMVKEQMEEIIDELKKAPL